MHNLLRIFNLVQMTTKGIETENIRLDLKKIICPLVCFLWKNKL